MICRDARELLSAWIDDQLTEAEELSVRAHLEGCDTCRSLAGELESVVSTVRSLPRVEATGDFTARVMGRVQRREERRGWWRDLLRWEPGSLMPAPALRVAAALVLGLFAGFGVAQWTPWSTAPATVSVDSRTLLGESLGAVPASAPAETPRLAGGTEIDYVLDRYTVVHGAAGAPAMRPVLANQDVPVRF